MSFLLLLDEQPVEESPLVDEDGSTPLPDEDGVTALADESEPE